MLVQAGTEGIAGHIGEQLGLPSATLAFHLKLKNAGLVTFTRNGRSLTYAAVPAMNAPLSDLTENCCGRPANLCLPTCQPEASTIRPC